MLEPALRSESAAEGSKKLVKVIMDFSPEDIDVDESEESLYRGNAGTIILINGYDPETRGAALVATCRAIKQCLRTSASQHVGVVLYGVDNSASNIKNVMEVMPLEPPNLTNYNKLKNVKLLKLLQTKQLKLSEALWHCNKMFNSCTKTLSSQTIVLLSRLDTPPTTNDETPTFDRIVELKNAEIDLKLINVSESEYEIHQFYKDLVLEANTSLPTKPVWIVEDLSRLILSESDRHLAVANLNFEISNDLSMGISIYKFLKSSAQIQPKKVYCSSETNAVVNRVTKTTKITIKNDNDMDVDEDDKEQPLLKSEVLYSTNYGNEKVSFTADEYKQINNPFGPPKLKLLGFKPATFLSMEKWYLKNSYFLFPNEKAIEGSTTAFKALHQACINTKTVAICVMCVRINSKPNIVALKPCTQPLGLDIEVGFDVIPLPFAENVRDLSSLETGHTADTSQQKKQILTNIIQSVQFDYSPNVFEDPKLQTLYRTIETKILNDDDIEPFFDTTEAKRETFNKINGEQFYKMFGPYGVTAVKRPSETIPANTKIQRNVDLDELNQRVQDQKVNAYTVSQLKEILKIKNATEALTGLKKNELVELVYEYCK